MDKIDEQLFETINVLAIRCSSFTSANTLEILITNLSYATNRKQTFQHIFLVIFCCIVFNIAIQSHAVLIALNVVFLVTMATKCYILVNLIEFGKEMHFMKSRRRIKKK